jgi:hypothetical protein
MYSFLLKVSFSQFNSILKKTTFLLVTMLVATTNLAHAGEAAPDKFKIALGGYTLLRYDTTMSLTDPDLGAGVSIDPEETLGLDTTTTVLRLNGHYRFTKSHALTYSWYSISTDGNKSIEQEFDWLDENGDIITIPIGARVDTRLDFDIYKVGYLWSFHHTDKVEMAAGAGLHLTRVAVGMRAETTSSGIDTQDVATTVPLPVVSFNLTYNITPKFSWGFRAEAFALKFEEWDGIYTDSSLAMEYRAFKNVGLGIGLNTNTLKVTEDTSEYKFIFDNRISGILVYAAAYF